MGIWKQIFSPLAQILNFGALLENGGRGMNMINP
jgi:hypothetical protein